MIATTTAYSSITLDLFGSEGLKNAVLVDTTPRPVKEGGRGHALFGTLGHAAAYSLERDILEDRLSVEGAFIPACFKDGEVPDEETREWWIRESMLTPTGAMVAFWASMVAHDWRELLPRLPVPVLLCYGRGQNAPYPTKIVGERLHGRIPERSRRRSGGTGVRRCGRRAGEARPRCRPLRLRLNRGGRGPGPCPPTTRYAAWSPRDAFARGSPRPWG